MFNKSLLIFLVFFNSICFLQAAEIKNDNLYLEVEIIPNAESLRLKTPGELTIQEIDSPFQIKFDNPNLVIELYKKIKADAIWKIGIKRAKTLAEARKFIKNFPETNFIEKNQVKIDGNQIYQEKIYSIYKRKSYQSYEAAKSDSDIDNWIEEDIEFDANEIYIYDQTTGEDYYIGAPIRLTSSAHISVFDVPKANFWNPQTYLTRTYYENMLVELSKIGKLNLISEVELEKYVAGVVPNEIGKNVPMQALRAQAIAARSEALYKVIHGVHKDDGFDLCASIHCQVYSGISDLSEPVKRAVNSTSYQVAEYDDKIINAVYSTNCGGITVNSAAAWDGPEIPYLQPRYDARYQESINLDDEYKARNWLRKNSEVFCNTTGQKGWRSKTYRWTKEYLISEFEELLNKRFEFGNFIDIEVAKRGNSGRISEIKIEGTKQELILDDRLQIRQILGGLRSTFFLIEVDDKIMFIGKGSGHGVGMCQMGAIEMAHQKYSAEEILKHYFTDIEIKRMNVKTNE
ncbi:MAG: SpoIID/LytB domain-containing protein [Candidatus Cloacimonetes bacterium]|nr:SpoIID/LytB domain-containing protein [Candidatus Cloacimonadota bacterium]MBS3766836.1 SpoIID/LytB domain-containing protein [Candidatus Cloacimonadota bacterium]